jgi:hypothetical protein
MTDSIQFPRWVPSDARQKLNHLHSVLGSEDGFRQFRDVVVRLATRPEMEEAWQEYNKHFAQTMPPGLLVWVAFSTWFSAYYNQIAVRAPKLHSGGKSALRNKLRASLFLVAESTYNTAHPDYDPQLARLFHLQPGLRQREWAACARAIADELLKIHPEIRAEKGVTEVTFTEIERVAAFFKHEAESRDVITRIAQPPRKKRAGKAEQVAFVNALCAARCWQPPLRRPYALVAILVNVVFDEPADLPWDADRVKHCYYSRSRNK